MKMNILQKILHDASTQEGMWCHNDSALTKTVNKNMDLETSLNSLWSGPDEFKNIAFIWQYTVTILVN